MRRPGWKSFSLAALAALGAALLFAPRPRLLEGIPFSQAIYDDHHRLLRLTLAEDGKYRLRLKLGDISPNLTEATLRHEDQYFYRHPGVNPAALARAGFHSFWKRDRRMGGSTITMQVVRLRDRLNTRTLAGKALQILRALQLERHYSKDEIYEAYLNLAPYGGNLEGAGAASLVYFHKDASQLNLAEALTLSVIPQSPVRRLPGGAAASPAAGGMTPGHDALVLARRALFEKWLQGHPHDIGLRAQLALPVALHTTAELPFRAPHFVDELTRAGRVGPVESTLDLELQDLLERKVKSYLAAGGEQGIHNAVVLLLDHRDMAVKGAVGSGDYFNVEIQGQVNGLGAKRSPGSALKPFIYGLAFDQGLIHPDTLLKDTPASFGGYNPENFDGEFLGPVPAHEALIHSRNIPAVQLAAGLHHPDLYEFMERGGVRGLRGREAYGLALALGGAEVTLEELVRLYAILPAGGQLRPLRKRASDPADAGELLLSPEASFMVLDILRENPRPDQHYRADLSRDAQAVAYKTGTSHGFHDAWSVAVTGPYVLGVWVGNFDNKSNAAFVGREAAAPLLFQITDALRDAGRLQSPLHPRARRPLNLVKVPVCALSGMLPGPHCPHTSLTWFIPGKSPIKVCDIHRKVAIVPATGRRACPGREAGLPAEVYEFWPSDLRKLFREAGVPRRLPPPPDAHCPLSDQAAFGAPPRITSPQDSLTYTLRIGGDGEKIPFLAVTDADSRTLRWFLNESLLGQSRSGELFFWTPRPGDFLLRAVDDHGRSDGRALHVVLQE